MKPAMIRFCVAAMMIVCVHARSAAQYYEGADHAPRFSTSYVSAGVLFRDFSPMSSNPLGDTASIHYNAVMPVMALRQEMIELLFGYTRYTMDGKSLEAILFGVTFMQEFRLIGERESRLSLLGVLSSDYTKSEATGPERETFNVGSFGGGLGLRYRYSSQSMDAFISGTFSAQYSTEGFGTGTGFSTVTLGESVFLFRSVPIFDGISLGYRLRYQTWSMSEDTFDYKSLSHGPFIGLIL